MVFYAMSKIFQTVNKYKFYWLIGWYFAPCQLYFSHSTAIYTGFIDWLIEWLINWLVCSTVSAVFQSFNCGFYSLVHLGVLSFLFYNTYMYVCMFVCLFVFYFPLENFHSYGDVTITGEGLQILTHARHLWPLSSEGSLAWHTYWDTGHLFLMVISVLQLSCQHLFLRLRTVAAGIGTPNLPHARWLLWSTTPLRRIT